MIAIDPSRKARAGALEHLSVSEARSRFGDQTETPLREPILKSLEEAGFVVGRNIVVDYRHSQGRSAVRAGDRTGAAAGGAPRAIWKRSDALLL